MQASTGTAIRAAAASPRRAFFPVHPGLVGRFREDSRNPADRRADQYYQFHEFDEFSDGSSWIPRRRWESLRSNDKKRRGTNVT